MGTGIFAVEQKNKVLCFNYLCAHRPLDCPQILRRRLFLFPWAVVFRDLKLFAFWEMLVFIGVILAGYIYVWKKGALEWEK